MTVPVPKSDDKDQVREPIISLKAFLLIGGAILWAANQDWLEMAEFFQIVAAQWRDFLRTIWTAILDALGVDIHLRNHQKDMLSLIAILTGSALFRQLFGKKPQPLFYPSIYSVSFKIANRFEKFEQAAGVGSVILMALMAVAIYLFALIPFVNTVEFTHDAIFIILTVSPFAFIYLYIREIYMLGKGLNKRKIIRYFSSYGIVLLLFFALLFVFSIPAVSTALDGVFSFFSTSRIVPVDPEPFVVRNYVNTLMGEGGIDLALIATSALLLHLTSGKSLKPIAQFLLLGVTFVLIGWLSGVIVKMYS